MFTSPLHALHDTLLNVVVAARPDGRIHGLLRVAPQKAQPFIAAALVMPAKHVQSYWYRYLEIAPSTHSCKTIDSRDEDCVHSVLTLCVGRGS